MVYPCVRAMLGTFRPFRRVACALAFAALAGCGSQPTGDEILRELTVASEAMAAELARAEHIGDLKANEARLRELAGRMSRLRRDARKATHASEETKRLYEPRLRAALRQIAEALVDWSREGKWDMLEWADELRGP